MSEFIQRIGPVERDIDPVYRVERARDEERREREQEPRKRKPKEPAAGSPRPAEQEGPVEGDDGHLHIDVRA